MPDEEKEKKEVVKRREREKNENVERERFTRKREKVEERREKWKNGRQKSKLHKFCFSQRTSSTSLSPSYEHMIQERRTE